MQIDICENTIRKILRRKRIYYKNLKIVKRTVEPKKKPTYEQKKDLAEIICYLLYKGYEWIVEDEAYMVSVIFILFILLFL